MIIQKIARRWKHSLWKRSPGGRKKLAEALARERLFRPCSSFLKHLAEGDLKRGADRLYLPAFQKIFALHAAFAANGLKGDLLEFGVLYGYTAQLFTKLIRQFQLEAMRLHLFDSFEGLPRPVGRDCYSYEVQQRIWCEGTMCVEEMIPLLLQQELGKHLGLKRLFVIKGFFQDVLVEHLQKSSLTKAALVHLDCDLYSASHFVLKTLIEREVVQEGMILICDDWMCSFGSETRCGQRQALYEIEAKYPQWHFEKYMNYGLGSQVFILTQSGYS